MDGNQGYNANQEKKQSTNFKHTNNFISTQRPIIASMIQFHATNTFHAYLSHLYRVAVSTAFYGQNGKTLDNNIQNRTMPPNELS